MFHLDWWIKFKHKVAFSCFWAKKERKSQPSDSVTQSHSRNLQQALTLCDSPRRKDPRWRFVDPEHWLAVTRQQTAGRLNFGTRIPGASPLWLAEGSQMTIDRPMFTTIIVIKLKQSWSGGPRWPAVAVDDFPGHHAGHPLPGLFRSVHRSPQEDGVLHYTLTAWESGTRQDFTSLASDNTITMQFWVRLKTFQWQGIALC